MMELTKGIEKLEIVLTSKDNTDFIDQTQILGKSLCVACREKPDLLQHLRYQYHADTTPQIVVWEYIHHTLVEMAKQKMPLVVQHYAAVTAVFDAKGIVSSQYDPAVIASTIVSNRNLDTLVAEEAKRHADAGGDDVMKDIRCDLSLIHI